MLNQSQIVKNAINHVHSNHVPYSISFTADVYLKYGEQLLKKYADDEIMADYRQGKLALNEAVSLGIGNSILSVPVPWWNWHDIPESFYKDEETPDYLPRTIGYGNYEGFFSRLKYLKEKYGVYLLAGIYCSHWEKAYFARGLENFLSDLAGSPEWAQNLLDMIIRKNIVMLENILPAPELDGVLLGSDWGSQNDLIMSPECWRKMIRRGEQEEYDLVRKYGKDVFVHSCGNVVKILDDLTEMGLDVLNPVQPECMDIFKLKDIYGDKLTFFGGISVQKTLPYGTVEEVERETRLVIETMSKNGGYIAAPSQDIQIDVPYENIVALIDVARSYS